MVLWTEWNKNLLKNLGPIQKSVALIRSKELMKGDVSEQIS